MEGRPKAGGGVDAGLIGTTGGGSRAQATYAGRPLYYYAGDQVAGDVEGQGIDGISYVLDAQGSAIRTAAPATSSTPGSGDGGYGYCPHHLVSSDDLTRFAPGEVASSTASGTAWPTSPARVSDPLRSRAWCPEHATWRLVMQPVRQAASGAAWPFGAKWSGLLLRKWSARVGGRAHTVGSRRM
ncbi:hypothetical protein [Streptomyces spiralis]